MRDGIGACGLAETEAEFLVFDQAEHSGVKGVVISSRNHEATVLHYHGDLGPRMSGGDHWTSAGEHGAQPRGHYQIGGARPLRQKVDVGGVQEIVEAVSWLQRKHGHVWVVSHEGFQSLAEGPVATKEEVNARVVGE